MSFFDPQGLYIHTQKSTKKGQILQKKPKHHLSATSATDIPFAKNVLLNQGYSIFGPGQGPTFSTYLTDFGTFTFFSSIPQQSHVITFNDLWLLYRDAFTTMLDIPDNELTGESKVDIIITSLYARFQGNLNSNNQIQTYTDNLLHLDFQNPHVASNTYYNVTPQGNTSCCIMRSTPGGGGFINQQYQQSGAQGTLGDAVSVNNWPQLKDQGLTEDISLVTFNSNHMSNYVSELRINFLIIIQLGIYQSQ